VQLPFSPEPEQVEANFENGVLTISVPKKGQQEKAHRIQVRASKGGQKNIEGSVSEQPQTEKREAKSGSKK
jgi:HSP20 family protein